MPAGSAETAGWRLTRIREVQVMVRRILVLAAAAIPALTACGSDDGVAAPELAFDPSFERFAVAELPPPADFVSPTDPDFEPNPFFPLILGTVWTFEAETDEGLERTVDVVTGD